MKSKKPQKDLENRKTHAHRTHKLTFSSYLLFTEPSIIVRWSNLEGEDFAFAMHRGFTPFLGTVKATERIQCSGDA